LNSANNTKSNIDSSAETVNKTVDNLSNTDKNDKSALIPIVDENVKAQPKKFVIGILPDNQ
jgi:hypothetical protein